MVKFLKCADGVEGTSDKNTVLSSRAPKDWLKAMHGGHAEWKEQPNYAVLVDTRDRPAPQLTYVPQENIEVRIPSSQGASMYDIRSGGPMGGGGPQKSRQKEQGCVNYVCDKEEGVKKSGNHIWKPHKEVHQKYRGKSAV